MHNALQFLGPDKSNKSKNGPFGMCWTFDTGYTPQDRFERQPIFAENRWALIFVGFLMHREELAERLAIPVGKLAQTTDSMLVMAAWQKWGEDCLPHLYGQFSFAVCDLEYHEIFAVQGSEGGPALFYYSDAERLILTTSRIFVFQMINLM